MIQPANCYARVQLILGELDLLRQEVGRPRDDRPTYKITGAAPREVFFEATALFRKADRFCFERTGEEGYLPHPPAAADIEPAHVLVVLDAALDRIRQVKDQLHITEATTEPAVDPARQPTDVLGAVLEASRQLNRLLDQPFTPSDVYQLLTLGAGYAARLCAHAGVEMPAPPPYERRKRPGDVFARVWACLGALREVSATAGLTMLEPGAAPYAVDDVLPSDCYDATSLLISELVYLHSRVKGLAPPGAAEMYEVGHKIPAHCYRRVAHLESGLRALAVAVSEQPALLRG
ncbi:MAG: hypothetical protein H6709_14255 [Kofleriaceae bacterium]|nr:hypothetical protein [Kofleriaceae bacterium]MCB9573244.1 hypothetical protein [Kofleriaceae bacterium]